MWCVLGKGKLLEMHKPQHYVEDIILQSHNVTICGSKCFPLLSYWKFMLVLFLLFILLTLQGVIVSQTYNTVPVVYSSLYFTLLYTILIVIVVNMYNNNFKKPFQTQCYSMWLQNARKQIKQLFETNKFITLTSSIW